MHAEMFTILYEELQCPLLEYEDDSAPCTLCRIAESYELSGDEKVDFIERCLKIGVGALNSHTHPWLPWDVGTKLPWKGQLINCATTLCETGGAESPCTDCHYEFFYDIGGYICGARLVTEKGLPGR